MTRHLVDATELMMMGKEELVEILMNISQQRNAYQAQIERLRGNVVDWLEGNDTPEAHKKTIIAIKATLFGH